MYASVIVDLSLEKLDRVFQYEVPQALAADVKLGVCVNVPFGKGKRELTGYVVDITDAPEIDPSRIKPILSLAAGMRPIESELIALAAFLRRYYGGTMNQALKTVLPMQREMGAAFKQTVKVAVDPAELDTLIKVSHNRQHVAKERLLVALKEHGALSGEIVRKKLHIRTGLIEGLKKQGIIEVVTERSYRSPMEAMLGKVPKKTPVTLSEAQRRIVEDIEANRGTNHLIHGVTGSGKTEVYMELAARAAARGESSIILIPEIALTFQTLVRFYERFGERVSIIHSKLSAGEKSDQLERAREGELDVMIGPRSALFTPFLHIGYIIIDEEQEESYRSETVPRYHARETAFERAKMHGATVVLGSATPSVGAYYMAKEGQLTLHELTKRAASNALATTHIVDLREELRAGNRSMLSRNLRDAIHDRLRRKEQTMLFLNRRGISGFVACRSCGTVIRCPHCDVSLSLHQDGKLKCHYCGYERVQVQVCETCGSKLIGTFKAGTQSVERLMRAEFKDARVLRMDYDTTRTKNGYSEILSAFANHEADILIGTQMIVKGHDFPLVTLVGVLAADLSLGVPDYTAAERTFSLLTQAAGRAGRGEKAGEVYIQTYQPEHFSVRAAAAQDYEAFYEQEIRYRRLMDYPPVQHLLQIFVASQDEEKVRALTAHIAAYLFEAYAGLRVIGPSEASIYRMNDVYRRQLFVKAPSHETLADVKDSTERYLATEPLYAGCSVVFDFS